MPFARIKPFAPKRGLTTKTYAVAGNLFRVDVGWYEVGDKLAKYLREEVLTDPTNPESTRIFDVVETLEEAKAMGATGEKAPPPPGKTNAGADDKPHDLLSEQVRPRSMRAALDTDEPNAGDEPAADAVPGGGDPEMAASPVSIPGAPKAKALPATKPKAPSSVAAK